MKLELALFTGNAAYTSGESPYGSVESMVPSKFAEEQLLVLRIG